MWLGQGGTETPRDFVYVTVGDGVGTGVVVNGEVMRGHDNTAGEFGHVAIDPSGPSACAARADVSRAGWRRTSPRFRGISATSFPGDDAHPAPGIGLGITDVIACAKNGDWRRATRARGNVARHLATVAFSVIINTLNPAQIFIGGEITEAWSPARAGDAQGHQGLALTPRAAGATPIAADLGVDVPLPAWGGRHWSPHRFSPQSQVA